MQTILGTKSNMTAIFNQFGHRVPVTSVIVEPNIIVGATNDKITLGFNKKKKSKKTENAFVKIAGYSPRFIREVKINKNSDSAKSQEKSKQNNIHLGDKITVSIFQPGDEVKVTGTTKGKGFAGVVKRWGFHGGPKTHGQSDRHRAPGSIGMGTTPGRVFKGKKMAGHMGNKKLTVTGLEIIKVDERKNLILIKGALPGPTNGFLIIEKTGKAKGFTPPPAPSEEKQAEKEAREEKVTEGTKEPQEPKGKEIKDSKSDNKQPSDSSGSSDTSVASQDKEQKDAKD